MRRLARPSTAAILFCLVHFLPATGQIAEKAFRTTLGVDGWGPEETAALERGDPVVRDLPTGDKQELASLGIIRVKDLGMVTMDVFRDSLSQKLSGPVQSGGTFSTPAVLDDLGALELDDETVEQLRKCSIRSCDLNLPADVIRELRALLDGGVADPRPLVTTVIRRMLVAFVESYRAQGDSGLGTYDNRRKSVDLQASHRALLADSTMIGKFAPEFADYLARYPAARLDGLEGAIRWSVIDFGLKPSITVSHTMAYAFGQGDAEQLIVFSKQIYSSRYLDSSLTATLLLRVSRGEQVDTYILFLDRSRSDVFEGPLGGFARKTVQKESVKKISSLLAAAQFRLVATQKRDLEPQASNDGEPLRYRIVTLLRSKPYFSVAVLLAVGGLVLLVLRRCRVRREPRR